MGVVQVATPLPPGARPGAGWVQQGGDAPPVGISPMHAACPCKRAVSPKGYQGYEAQQTHARAALQQAVLQGHSAGVPPPALVPDTPPVTPCRGCLLAFSFLLNKLHVVPKLVTKIKEAAQDPGTTV